MWQMRKAASLACGNATSLQMIILFHVAQRMDLIPNCLHKENQSQIHLSCTEFGLNVYLFGTSLSVDVIKKTNIVIVKVFYPI